jgi:hypothetical protein
MSDAEATQLADLVMTCAHAVISGQATVTLSVRGTRPPGFPRGELLSVGASGEKNYAVDPVKALAWVHARTSKTPNVEVTWSPPCKS